VSGSSSTRTLLSRAIRAAGRPSLAWRRKAVVPRVLIPAAGWLAGLTPLFPSFLLSHKTRRLVTSVLCGSLSHSLP
jgi:hypothetical protein